MDPKLPPQNIEAEQSVLGSILIDPESLFKIADFLMPEHYYDSRNEVIYKAVLELYEKRRPIDMITVPTQLKKSGALTVAGGVGYLTDLVNNTPTSANIETYAHLIKDAFTRRSMIKVSAKIGELAFNDADNVNELLDKAETEIFAISQDYLKQDFVPVRRTLETSFDRIEYLHKTKGALRGVSTGLKNMDRILNGLQESNLIILAARPSVGKSSLAINIAEYAAVTKKAPVGIFSLEMSREQLVDRMLSSQSGVDNWKISTGNLSDQDFKDLGDAMGELAEAPIYIDDTPGISIMEMRTKARRLHLDKGLKLLIVDYLQLARGRNLENRVQEVSEISQALKNIARELKIPVLACAQLSRAVEQRGGKVPQLSDLRESGSIEQDSDVVMFLYRPDEEDRSYIKLLVSKHRNGPTGDIDLFFKGEITRFFEVEMGKGGGG